MKWNRWLGIILVALSATGLVISLWPVPVHSSQVIFTSSEGVTGTLLVTHPDQIHVGEKTEVSLEILVDKMQNALDPITFLTKLELDSIAVTPKGEGKVSVDPSKPVTLIWQIIPYKPGVYSGTLWLFIEQGDVQRDLILAKPVELTAKTFFGFSFRTIRMVSIVGLIVGFVYLFIKILKKQPG